MREYYNTTSEPRRAALKELLEREPPESYKLEARQLASSVEPQEIDLEINRLEGLRAIARQRGEFAAQLAADVQIKALEERMGGLPL